LFFFSFCYKSLGFSPTQLCPEFAQSKQLPVKTQLCSFGSQEEQDCPQSELQFEQLEQLSSSVSFLNGT